MIGIILGTFLCALITGAAGALAYGYRGQRDQEREQVEYLRAQLSAREGIRSNLPAVVDGGRR
ncbi:MAG: hypothetical protein BroJett013_06990 [Alphaproteobacteria bacterium]|nr:MAG: hypothetical protein BroJett013_06990 [Alphaproteobacteria bacterium]